MFLNMPVYLRTCLVPAPIATGSIVEPTTLFTGQ